MTMAALQLCQSCNSRYEQPPQGLQVEHSDKKRLSSSGVFEDLAPFGSERLAEAQNLCDLALLIADEEIQAKDAAV